MMQNKLLSKQSNTTWNVSHTCWYGVEIYKPRRRMKLSPEIVEIVEAAIHPSSFVDFSTVPSATNK